ncbi:enoyl-CoA hydratase/isomerase family protein [Alkalihalobacillus sp. AL-G]|uniref:enoyl-CoA hydratase/isomerase family protein n=1 Tax=Alkalihalobacillus sp. AL-G TaxID=2926399 RepID=UPI00272D84ED|nr:enoyl-CoA hydratase-related protein [Alkalihalobacillus sp. AL-G]WLD93076.1 enoyl-CoA hydratase-related protein [Alkalihalobacillus sp. AL-G]
MERKHLLIDVQNNIGTITINRPEQRNSLDVESWEELRAAIRHLNDDGEVRVIVLTGAGDKSFAAGADIKWIKDRKPLDIYGSAVQDVLLELYKSYKPIIAAVNGYALGGGCELMTACDFRIASSRAKMGQPEINLGILPAGGGTQQLTKIVGLQHAKELILTGKIISADEAYRIGLVNEVVEHEFLMDKVYSLASELASKPPVALKLAKIALNESATADLSTGLALEKALQAVLFGTKDKVEGTEAFFDKREPKFVGE